MRTKEWRREYFREMGFSRIQAGILADTHDVSRERVKQLLDSGCSHRLVVAILRD